MIQNKITQEQGQKLWDTLVEMCMATEAVVPKINAPRQTIDELISYHTELEKFYLKL